MNKLTMMFAAIALAVGTSASAATPEEELQKFAPEAKTFRTVYVVDAFSGVNNGNKKYVRDNSDAFAGKKIKKIGYYMRLVGNDGKVQQVFVTMEYKVTDKETGNTDHGTDKVPYAETDGGSVPSEEFRDAVSNEKACDIFSDTGNSGSDKEACRFFPNTSHRSSNEKATGSFSDTDVFRPRKDPYAGFSGTCCTPCFHSGSKDFGNF